MKTSLSLANGKEKTETVLSHRKAVERVIKNVGEKLDEPVTMEEMARMAHMSPFHFNRVFHQITGLPPSQFLYAMRLEKAKRLLLTTKMSVTDICFEIGYNSLGTFTSRFSELVGLSPREYRRLGKQIRSFDWDRLFSEGWRQSGDKSIEPSLNGNITTPENFEGLIFIGLFNQMIPQSQPVSGTMLTRGGAFSLNSPTEGEFYLLSAALPRAEDALEYLLPDFSKILVGVDEYNENSSAQADMIISLRPIRLTDPPILLALPNLLATEMLQLTASD